MRRLLRRALARSKPGRLGDRGKGLDQFADRERQVEKFCIGQGRFDEGDRAPSRLAALIASPLAHVHARTCGSSMDRAAHDVWHDQRIALTVAYRDIEVVDLTEAVAPELERICERSDPASPTSNALRRK